jgi:hypothetical protein
MARYYDLDKLSKMIEARADTMLEGKCAMLYVAKWLNLLPTADVAEVKHAKWEINCDGYYPYCGNCKAEPKNGVMSKYCPECGAKMDGKE